MAMDGEKLGKDLKKDVLAVLDPSNPSANLNKTEKIWIAVGKAIVKHITDNAEVPVGIDVDLGTKKTITPGKVT